MKKPNNFEVSVLKVPCPACGAKIGERCTFNGVGSRLRICCKERWMLRDTLPVGPLRVGTDVYTPKVFRANTSPKCKQEKHEGDPEGCAGFLRPKWSVPIACGCICHDRKKQAETLAKKVQRRFY